MWILRKLEEEDVYKRQLQLNNGQLLNADKSNVDMSVIPTGLRSNPNYVFGEVKVVEIKK